MSILTNFTKFDLVTFLLNLAGRVAARRAKELLAREANLKAAIQAATAAYQEVIPKRIDAQYRAGDITRVK